MGSSLAARPSRSVRAGPSLGPGVGVHEQLAGLTHCAVWPLWCRRAGRRLARRPPQQVRGLGHPSGCCSSAALWPELHLGKSSRVPILLLCRGGLAGLQASAAANAQQGRFTTATAAQAQQLQNNLQQVRGSAFAGALLPFVVQAPGPGPGSQQQRHRDTARTAVRVHRADVASCGRAGSPRRLHVQLCARSGALRVARSVRAARWPVPGAAGSAGRAGQRDAGQRGRCSSDGRGRECGRSAGSPAAQHADTHGDPPGRRSGQPGAARARRRWHAELPAGDARGAAGQSSAQQPPRGHQPAGQPAGAGGAAAGADNGRGRAHARGQLDGGGAHAGGQRARPRSALHALPQQGARAAAAACVPQLTQADPARAACAVVPPARRTGAPA